MASRNGQTSAILVTPLNNLTPTSAYLPNTIPVGQHLRASMKKQPIPTSMATKPFYRTVPTSPNSELQAPKKDEIWLEPLLATKCGFPIKITRAPKSSHNNLNAAIHALFWNPNADDPDFGFIHIGDFRGDALVVRQDGKALEPQHLEALHEYVHSLSLRKFAQAADGSKEKTTLKQAIVQRLKPEGFHAWFLEWKRRQTAKGPQKYQDLESPVQVTLGAGVAILPACVSCGGFGEGVRLMKCGKCQGPRYCGRECQKRDWAGHKRVCGKLEGREWQR